MLDLETRYLLFRHATVDESYSDGDVIFDQGEAGECMYLVKSGRVRIQVGDRVLETVEEGGLFGEMALVDGLARSARAVSRRRLRMV